MKTLVLTGGSCSGKTSIVHNLEQDFSEQIVVVREVATTLLKGKFPVPPSDHPEFERWQTLFEQAIFPAQIALEDAHKMLVAPDIKLMVCDRGLLDVDAYAPGCSDELLRRHNMSRQEALARYDMVINLVSVALTKPAAYGRIGNKYRFETPERARELEERCQDAWADHPNRHIIDGGGKLDAKIQQVFELVRQMLAD